MRVNPRINSGSKEDNCIREGQLATQHASKESNGIFHSWLDPNKNYEIYRINVVHNFVTHLLQ
jgi:hypothetical protein